jgi:hypothetical protein
MWIRIRIRIRNTAEKRRLKKWLSIAGIYAADGGAARGQRRPHPRGQPPVHRAQHLPPQVPEAPPQRRGGGRGGQVHHLPLRVRGGGGREAAALHASLPCGVRGSVAGPEQALPYLQVPYSLVQTLVSKYETLPYSSFKKLIFLTKSGSLIK